jgi:hypothetical protein
MYLQWSNSDIYSGTKKTHVFLFVFTVALTVVFTKKRMYLQLYLWKNPMYVQWILQKITHVFDFLGKYHSKK